MSMPLLFLKATQTFLVTAKVVENRLLCTYHVIQLIIWKHSLICSSSWLLLYLTIFWTNSVSQAKSCSRLLAWTIAIRLQKHQFWGRPPFSKCLSAEQKVLCLLPAPPFCAQIFLKEMHQFSCFWNLWIWNTKHGTMDKHHYLVSQNNKESGP